MIYKLILTTKIKKDIKLLKKRGYNISLLGNVIDILMAGRKLPEKYYNHKLTGIYSGFNECHILPDWLLIYKIDNNNLILTAVRTGTHSDLF